MTTVAIIGAGKTGSGLARPLASNGIDVVIGHRDPPKAAAKLADAAILAVNCGAAEEALKGGGDLTGKVVVDTSNPITPDYKALTVGHTTSAAAEIQRLVPGARVMRAFNTIFAQLLPAPR